MPNAIMKYNKIVLTSLFRTHTEEFLAFGVMQTYKMIKARVFGLKFLFSFTLQILHILFLLKMHHILSRCRLALKVIILIIKAW